MPVETGTVKEEAPVSNLRLYEQLEVNKAKKEEGESPLLRPPVTRPLILLSPSSPEFQKKYKANFAPPSGSAASSRVTRLLRRARWPSGTTQELRDVPAGRLVVREAEAKNRATAAN